MNLLSRIILVVTAVLVASTSATAKERRNLFTEEKIASAREKIRAHEWAMRAVARNQLATAKWIQMSDEELWNFVPPPEQLRALNVAFGRGCPIHGTEVFRRGGHYPWLTSDRRPFKVRCPVGDEEYPSNDFDGWNRASITEAPQRGPGYEDRGAGWVNEEGERFFFVGYYVFWHRWQREVLRAIPALAETYLMTGDELYARKAAVLLARVAANYDRYDYSTQAYHNGRWPAAIPGRVLDYVWSTDTITTFAQAYDAIFPALNNPDLRAFLHRKGLADPGQHIEQKMLRIMAEDIMIGAVRGNQGSHQRALAALAIVLDNDSPARGPTRQQMISWILDGPEGVQFLLWNGFHRDGHAAESAPGYAESWAINYFQLARLLSLKGVDLWSHPRFKKIAEVGLDLAIAGRFTPSIGDSGSIFGVRTKYGSPLTGWAPSVLAMAFATYGDPRFAQALVHLGVEDASLSEIQVEAGVHAGAEAVALGDFNVPPPPFEVDMEAARRIANGIGPLQVKTRNLAGYGLAILESGMGETARGISMYYGSADGGHGHRDRLTLEMVDARFPSPVLNEMGYPTHWLEKNVYWTSNTVSHYGVVVNETWQQTKHRGVINTLSSSPGVQFIDASAGSIAYPSIPVYRRSVALIDLSATTSYVLDIFRVRGGTQHDYSYHGPPFPEFETTSLPTRVQTRGTLAGVDVPRGSRFSTEATALPLILDGAALDVEYAPGLMDDPRSYAIRAREGWTEYGDGALVRKTGAVLKLDAKLPARTARVWIRAYDYNRGTNILEVATPSESTNITWTASGRSGYRWLSAAIHGSRDADSLTLTARQIGQPYLLIDKLLVSSDVDSKVPVVWDRTTSGFQYLYNVRRQIPHKSWSGTWRDPDSTLGLTVTMPAGATQEIILAEAEPELQPGAPKSLHYLIARNRADTPDLDSTFVTVSEPHRGRPRIERVDRLKNSTSVHGAVGLEIEHAAGRHLIHSSPDPRKRHQWHTNTGDTFLVSAEFAFVSIDEGGIASATLTNGTELEHGDLHLQVDHSPEGTIAVLDHSRNSITIDVDIAAPEALVGSTIIIGNDAHQTSYTVASATRRGSRTVLGFGDVSHIVGAGIVGEIDRDAMKIATATVLNGHGIVDGGRHSGRWLVNENKSRGLRILHFDGSEFELDGIGDLEVIFADTNGDGVRGFWVSDIGPGDWCRLPSVTYVRRRPDGSFEIEGTNPASIVRSGEATTHQR